MDDDSRCASNFSCIQFISLQQKSRYRSAQQHKTGKNLYNRTTEKQQHHVVKCRRQLPSFIIYRGGVCRANGSLMVTVAILMHAEHSLYSLSFCSGKALDVIKGDSFNSTVLSTHSGYFHTVATAIFSPVRGLLGGEGVTGGTKITTNDYVWLLDAFPRCLFSPPDREG
ncbi:Hypothetical predicted protein [Scomber scombrus]|uniref:Uncharacterized protein n=1 Tax=Scomber scombrus TaxID=13677 RepID=A0AAV1P743_SCOSC